MKTRTGPDYSNVRAVPPKMFAADETERDPVAVYKFFARKRPEEMNQDDAPFYLAVNYGAPFVSKLFISVMYNVQS